MGAVRAGLLVLYLVGTYVLSGYLRDRFSDGGPPSSGAEMVSVLFRVWAPTLWVFPGVLWFGVLNLPLVQILILSVLLPLSALSVLLVLSGAFTAKGASTGSSAILTAGFILLVTAGALAFSLLESGLSYARFALFCLGLIIPPSVSVWFLAIWSREVVMLPPKAAKPTKTALAMILGFFSGAPKSAWSVEDGKIHARISGNPSTGMGPGLLITEPENVVVMKAGARLTRVAGPGAVLTDPGEVPFRVVDLRNQLRATQVDGITRDGIEVEMPVSCAFRIARGRGKVSLGVSWPYRTQGDVLQAIFSEEVDPTGRSPLDANTAHPWEDLPIQIAAHKLEQAISFYSLDQLYAGITDSRAAELSDDPQNALLKTHRRVEKAMGLPAAETLGDVLCRQTLGKLVTRTVRQELGPRGFQIVDGGVNQAAEPLNQGVTDQRVEAWKSRFITKVMDWNASIERQRFEALGKIRRQAREQLLTEVVEETSERLESADPDLRRDFIAVHLLDNLIQIARDPDVQKMLPESALPTLEYVYSQVEGTRALEEEG